MRPSRRRSAFTLVELLVVIAIIGILIGMLLPAVQQVREAARRVQCLNNIRQQALALHNYHSAHDEFPAYTSPQSGLKGWCWGTTILPFMEQDNLYELLDAKSYNFAEVQAETAGVEALAALATVIPAYRCPSTDAPETFEREASGVQLSFGISSYVANRGFGHAGRWDNKLANNGGLGPEPLNIGEISDGTSNTIILGETSARWGGWVSNPTAGDFGRGMGSWAGNFTTRWWDYQSVLTRCGAHPMNHIYHWGFTSAHPGTGNFALADGSVHALSESIDFNSAGIGGTWYTPEKLAYFQEHSSEMGAYQRLIVRNDGQPVSVDD